MGFFPLLCKSCHRSQTLTCRTSPEERLLRQSSTKDQRSTSTRRRTSKQIKITNDEEQSLSTFQNCRQYPRCSNFEIQRGEGYSPNFQNQSGNIRNTSEYFSNFGIVPLPHCCSRTHIRTHARTHTHTILPIAHCSPTIATLLFSLTE